VEVRWPQRFSSFEKAFRQLERFLSKTELNVEKEKNK
jgi:hypothetical protein